jgi:hypothetical protein
MEEEEAGGSPTVRVDSRVEKNRGTAEFGRQWAWWSLRRGGDGGSGSKSYGSCDALEGQSRQQAEGGGERGVARCELMRRGVEGGNLGMAATEPFLSSRDSAG